MLLSINVVFLNNRLNVLNMSARGVYSFVVNAHKCNNITREFVFLTKKMLYVYAKGKINKITD